MNTPLSLYNKSLLTVINIENLAVNNLPKPILYEIGVIQSLHQKWTNKCIYYDMYLSTRDELDEIRDDTRRCADCDWLNYCDFHQLVTDYLRHKRRELLKIIWETNNVYWDEIDKVRKTSPQFADVLYHLRLIS